MPDNSSSWALAPLDPGAPSFSVQAAPRQQQKGAHADWLEAATGVLSSFHEGQATDRTLTCSEGSSRDCAWFCSGPSVLSY